MVDFEEAKDKVMMGVERRSMVISEKEKKTTAYHEAGHALVAAILPGTDPLHKVTIIPRGRALGVTMQLPMDEKHTHQRSYLINSLAILMGGRCAEEICLGEMTTGAGNDIERATEMARKMVCEWGMSEKMGPLTYGTNEEQPFLGKGSSSQANFSDQTAKLIDQEVKSLVMGGYEKATELLKTNLDKLETMAQALLEHETLNAQHVKNIIDGKNIFDDEDSGTPQNLKSDDESPVEKKEPKADSEDGLLGGGMPDPAPA